MSESLTPKVILAGVLAASGATFDNHREYVSSDDKTIIAVEKAVKSVDPIIKIKRYEEGHHKADKSIVESNENIKSGMTNDDVNAYIKSIEATNKKLVSQLDQSSSALKTYLKGANK